MERKKLSKIHMKGSYIPAFVLVIIGFIHMKLNMVENEGSQYFLTKSPYLLRIRYHYLEYTKRMRMKTSELVYPIQKKLLDKDTERIVLLNRKAEIERKEGTLGNKQESGNEIRAQIALQKSKDENVEALAQTNAAIVELEKEIEGIREHERLSVERMLEVAISKSYSYIEGCQKAGKTKSFYAKSEDHDEQLFQFITENSATT
ncbi:MAG: hypothetical protein PUB52_02090 [Lachnospiraceae bacterium]|nr:hypothetical protein [Lachnospiraceae bacterium]